VIIRHPPGSGGIEARIVRLAGFGNKIHFRPIACVHVAVSEIWILAVDRDRLSHFPEPLPETGQSAFHPSPS
jgi:hypothetical protein